MYQQHEQHSQTSRAHDTEERGAVSGERVKDIRSSVPAEMAAASEKGPR